MESHKVMVTVMNSPNNEAAIANATLWLNEGVGGLETVQDVSAKTWKGDHNVTFRVLLSEEQVQTVKESDDLTHLGQ